MGRSVVVTLSLDEELYRRLKEYARKKYGGGKGHIKKAVEEMIRKGLVDEVEELIDLLREGIELGGPPKREELYDRG